jgi:hypothetical protein
MQEVKLRRDYGVAHTQEKWAGNYLTEEAYDQVISATEDTVIFKPGASLYDDVPLAYVVCNAYPDSRVIECLNSIDDVSTMRANASGPIHHEEMKKKGLVEGKDYVLRTPNSYYPLKKNGEFNRIAEANAIHSVFAGYKRGRFNGMIGLSNWCEKKSNIDKWGQMHLLS